MYKCSILGSFRKFYTEVVDTIELFKSAEIEVVSPMKSHITNPGDSFVRFHSDSLDATDEEIELLTLIRIFSSDFVYVLNPNGYIGITTCYEIGRVHERNIPVYFSHYPDDLPIVVSESAIISSNDLANYIQKLKSLPPISYSNTPVKLRELLSQL